MKLGLVIAGATGWSDDVEALTAMTGGSWPGLIVGVNDVGTVIEDIDELCTLHHEGRTGWNNQPPTPWAKLRQENELPPVPVVACANSTAWPIDVTWKSGPHEKDRWTDGSSGLYGVSRLLHHHECDRVVVAGVRMDPLSNAFRDEPRWAQHERYRRGWTKAHRLPVLKERVRSMSGWTRELLGVPTLEWLGLEQPRAPV